MEVTVHDPPLLFDLITDRSEKKNIAPNEPEILKKMIEEYHLVVEDIVGESKRID